MTVESRKNPSARRRDDARKCLNGPIRLAGLVSVGFLMTSTGRAAPANVNFGECFRAFIIVTILTSYRHVVFFVGCVLLHILQINAVSCLLDSNFAPFFFHLPSAVVVVSGINALHPASFFILINIARYIFLDFFFFKLAHSFSNCNWKIVLSAFHLKTSCMLKTIFCLSLSRISKANLITLSHVHLKKKIRSTRSISTFGGVFTSAGNQLLYSGWWLMMNIVVPIYTVYI